MPDEIKQLIGYGGGEELQALCERQDVALTEAYNVIYGLIAKPANEAPSTHARIDAEVFLRSQGQS